MIFFQFIRDVYPIGTQFWIQRISQPIISTTITYRRIYEIDGEHIIHTRDDRYNKFSDITKFTFVQFFKIV